MKQDVQASPWFLNAIRHRVVGYVNLIGIQEADDLQSRFLNVISVAVIPVKRIDLPLKPVSSMEE
jgi:hypothetical protein